MEIIYHHDPQGNFGDDLNAVLWRHILPAQVLESDQLALVGIGSILNEEKLGRLRGDARRIVVIGTGVSYGVPPAHTSGWLIDAVRGPITAQLVGRPDASATDGAALLATATTLLPPKTIRRGCVFIPHHSSLSYNAWADVCELCGIRYVSPREKIENVILAISGAELVVSEAMHGAIIADTLRVPWVPVVSTAVIDELKWRDWTRSLLLPFSPMYIPPTTPMARLAAELIAGKYRAHSVDGVDRLQDIASSDGYFDYLARRRAAFISSAIPRSRRALMKIKAFGQRLKRRETLHQAAEALQAAARSTPYMSDERVFADRLDKLQTAVAKLDRLA